MSRAVIGPARLTAVVFLLAMTLGAAQATAQDPLPPRFSFGGFGTFGMAHSDERRGDFTSTIFKPDGAGYSHPWSADVDSLVGVQGTVRVTKKLSAVVQLVSEQNVDGTYWPHVEWANAKYELTPDLRVRVGRIVLPAFRLSDTRKVGYVTPWVRPPFEVYSLLPNTSNDGVDISFSRRWGGMTNTFQVNFGRNTRSASEDGETVRARRAWGLNYSAERGSLTARASYQRARLTITPVRPIFDGLHSQARADNLSDPGVTTAGLPPPVAGPAMGLNAALNSLLRGKRDQSTVSVGGRFDFPKNTALTLQLDRIRMGAGSTGGLIQVQPDFPTNGATVHLVSVAIDVVF